VMIRLFRATVATCRWNNANTASANARMATQTGLLRYVINGLNDER